MRTRKQIRRVTSFSIPRVFTIVRANAFETLESQPPKRSGSLRRPRLCSLVSRRISQWQSFLAAVREAFGARINRRNDSPQSASVTPGATVGGPSSVFDALPCVARLQETSITRPNVGCGSTARVSQAPHDSTTARCPATPQCHQATSPAPSVQAEECQAQPDLRT